MKRAPAFQFYAADWFDFKVTRMSFAAQGVYMRLLTYMWKDSKDQCSLVDSNEDIARALGSSTEQWLEWRAEIQRETDPLFLQKGGKLISLRLKYEATKQQQYRQLQKDKALSRQASYRLAASSVQASLQLGTSLQSSSSSSSSKEEEEEGGDVLRTSSRPPSSDFLTVKKLVAMYDAMKPDECPPSKALTESRYKKYAGYLKQFPQEPYWEAVFSQLCQSRFLRGLESYDDRPPVARDLDWLCQKGEKDRIENCQKTYEGKYRSTPQGQLPLNGEWYPDDLTHPLAKDPE